MQCSQVQQTLEKHLSHAGLLQEFNVSCEPACPKPYCHFIFYSMVLTSGGFPLQTWEEASLAECKVVQCDMFVGAIDSISINYLKILVIKGKIYILRATM